MNTQEQRQQAREEHERYQRHVVDIYHRVFHSPDGQAILEDLIRVFGMKMPTFISTATRMGQPVTIDTHYAAKRDGQQDVYRHIMAKLEAQASPRANIEVFTGVTNE